MRGEFIGVKEQTDIFSIEKRFIACIGTAKLRATAFGLYFVEINGVRVGKDYLTPGWTSYNKMLQVQEYDVTALINEGENTIKLTVANGWYCGKITYLDKQKFYGNKSAVCADLLLPDCTVSTDESWEAKESFIRQSSLYDGETQDYTVPLKPLTACMVAYDKSVLVEQICEPVRTTERVAVKEIIHTPAGELVYDFGQNLAGVAEITTPEDFDGTLKLQFAEILVGGNFYTENLRSAKATDIFTVKGAKTLSPEFTYHGFRYMKLEGAELPKENVTALVRHTDMKRTGYIQTSDVRFNRLMDNVVWGQRGNFVDIPTDCPQRDERLGWTGDINAFCVTAAYNYDVRRVLKKWLADVRNDQCENGEVPHVIPHVLDSKDAGAGALWCDAITMVPWKLYQMYGDISYLADNYEAMKKFVAARERNCENGLTAHGFEHGDWLALDKEVSVPESSFARTDVYFLSSVFYAESLRIVAATARLLGKHEDEQNYSARRKKLIKDIRYEYFTRSGRLAIDTVTAQVIALYFNIVEDKHRARLAKELNDNVLKHNCHMTTGFIGAPYILFALADNGYTDTAAKVLLNDEYPGWLHEVDMGATTIWERWNSLLPDGTPNPDEMTSYNHYAYGSVMEFVYRRIAGIECVTPGFAKVRIAPTVMKGLDCVKAEYESINGKIVSAYDVKDGKTYYNIDLADTVKAEIVLPDRKPFIVKGGKHKYIVSGV